MKAHEQISLTHLWTWSLVFFLVAGCANQPSTPQNQATLVSTATEDTQGLSANVAATLGSLEKVDEYPFYTMHYVGGYEYPRISQAQGELPGFGCSLFASLGEANDKYYGRNFDWEFSPALLLFTNPPDGYASASMVDLTFLGISPEKSKKLSELPLSERMDLLKSPALPFDGMNEYGLTIGMAAIPDEFADDTSYEASRSTIGSIGIMRQVLDHAKNVDEAIKIFGKYNIDFSGGPAIHYLLADSSGKAALIEFYQNTMVVMPNDDPWHMATNHLRCTVNGDGGCPRYHILSDRLSQLNGRLDVGTGMQLLSEVKQDSTQWSVLYNMTSGDIHLVIGKAYEATYTFHLEIVNR